MADFVFNIAKGRVAELAKRVDGGASNEALIVVVINAGAATDATLKDYTTLAAVLGDPDAAEVTNASGYARKTLTASDVTVTFDNTSDTAKVDITDQTWTAVSANPAWTDLLICYDSDTTGGTDANIVPLTCHDFAVTPDGSDITAQIATDGFFTAT